MLKPWQALQEWNDSGMKVSWVVFGFLVGAVLGAPVGVVTYGVLRLTEWPVTLPDDSYAMVRWAGAAAFAGGILGAFGYSAKRWYDLRFGHSGPAVEDWRGYLVLGTFCGAWTGMAGGGFCGGFYDWGHSASDLAFWCAGAGAVVGSPVGLAIGALFGAVALRRGEMKSSMETDQ